MWCASDSHNNMRHLCAKELLNSNFNYAVIYKVSIFKEITPNFTYVTQSYITRNKSQEMFLNK